METSATEVRMISPQTPVLIADAYVEAFEAEDEVEEAEEGALTFELEHQLRDFIVSNLASISVNGGRLTLFSDSQGRNGREYPTPVGFIDILAQDDTGALYAFELKRGRTSDHTVGQVLRYMGWLQRHLAAGREVYGIVVAKTLNDKLRYAVSAASNVTAFEYELAFQLKPATLD